MKRLATMLFLMTATGLLMPGCEKKLAVASVQGTVKINGVLASGIGVQFYPDHKKNTRGPRSEGLTDENGAFTLKTDTGEEGAVIGFHRVILDDTRRKVAQQGEVPSQDDTRIPERYTQLGITPVIVEVKPGQPIVIEVTRP